MALLRASRDFRDAILEAAHRLGIPARQVEKDYWVTEVLRELVSRFGTDFLFKGGTSLSKAYKLIRRFSEDVDLLLLSAAGAETERLLDAIQDAAGRLCGQGTSTERSTEGLARVVIVPFPKVRDVPRAPGMRQAIRLEPGVRGGPHPYERRLVDSLMAEALGLKDAEDLVPFEVPVLHPARTLVEKLFAVDALAAKLMADVEHRVADTEARHYYDLYFLWDEEASPAMGWLADEENFTAVVNDCIEVSQRWYPASPARVPEGGFCNSPAFTDGSVIERIASSYEKMLVELCYPGAVRPSFDDIRARAAAVSDRFCPGP